MWPGISPEAQTIPIAIYFAIQAGDMDKAMVLCIIVLVISFVSLAAIAYWKGIATRTKPVKLVEIKRVIRLRCLKNSISNAINN